MKNSKKPTPKPRVERTRNASTETQSMHMSKIRSALRNISRWWKPFSVALKQASHTTFSGKVKRVVYQCAVCNKLHSRKNVEVNHIIPVGSLKTYSDLPGFCERLFVENIDLLEVVCKECHAGITSEQRKKV